MIIEPNFRAIFVNAHERINMGPTRAGGAQTQTGGTRTDVIVKALTVEDLRLELHKFHEPLLEDFGKKVTAAVQEMKDYVDGEMGIVISRIEKVEAASAEALGPAELVVQRLPKSDDENPPNLINKIASIFRAMGLDNIHIINLEHSEWEDLTTLVMYRS